MMTHISKILGFKKVKFIYLFGVVGNILVFSKHGLKLNFERPL